MEMFWPTPTDTRIRSLDCTSIPLPVSGHGFQQLCSLVQPISKNQATQKITFVSHVCRHHTKYGILILAADIIGGTNKITYGLNQLFYRN